MEEFLGLGAWVFLVCFISAGTSWGRCHLVSGGVNLIGWVFVTRLGRSVQSYPVLGYHGWVPFLGTPPATGSYHRRNTTCHYLGLPG